MTSMLCHQSTDLPRIPQAQYKRFEARGEIRREFLLQSITSSPSPENPSPDWQPNQLCAVSLHCKFAKNAQEILCGSPPRLVINHVWPCLEAPFHALDTSQNNRYSLFLHCGAQNVIPTTHLFENQPPLQSVIWDAYQPGHLTIRLKQTRAC